MEPHEEVTKTEARAGDSRKMNRIVLAISLALVVVAFAALLIVFGAA